MTRHGAHFEGGDCYIFRAQTVIPRIESTTSRSLELIVGGYVRLNDRDALHDILAHRQDLPRQLISVTGVDPKQAIAQVSEEITIIEAGLATLAPD
ncbi:hypothetical protein [Bradyrhizobium sp. USDA 4486]